MCLVRRSAWVVPARLQNPFQTKIQMVDPGSGSCRHRVTEGRPHCRQLGWWSADDSQEERTSCLRVVSSVNVNDSLGMLVTNGPTSHPRPTGIPLVSDTDSHWTYSPPSRDRSLQYVFSRHRYPPS